MKHTIGVDPEFFLVKEGKFVSAHGLVEGTKNKPYKLKGGAVQVDGTALEFNIDPCSSFEEFDDTIDLVLDQIREMIPKEYSFLFHPTVEFSKKYFESLPKEAIELGCDPDYNIYYKRQNDKPYQNNLFRTGAGHIHYGFTEGANINFTTHKINSSIVIMMSDALVALPLKNIEPDNKRNSMYGELGDCRFKSYGVEHRSPSNFWLSDKKLREFVFRGTEEVMKICKEGGPVYEKVIRLFKNRKPNDFLSCMPDKLPRTDEILNSEYFSDSYKELYSEVV